MKGTTIAFAALGVMNIGLICLDHAADRHAKKIAEAEAIKNRGEEANALLEAAKNRCDIYENLMKREKDKFKQKRADWMEANGFNTKKNDILDGVQNGLADFKTQIGYSDLKQRIEDEYKAGVEAVENALGYSANKASYEKAINDAKSHYDGQKALYDSASSEFSEDAMKLRHAAEEAMNAKIKEAKANLDILEGKRTAEVEKLDQAKTNSIRELEEKISKEKIRLDHKADQELKTLNEELEKAEGEIRRSVSLERTPEELKSETQHHNDIRVIREQKDLDAKAADDIFNAKSKTVKIAEFMKDKKVPKAVVGVCGYGCLAPVGYLSYRWCKLVTQVMRAM